MKTSMIFVSTLVLTALVLMLFSLSGYWAWAVLIVALLFAAAKLGQSLLSCVRRRRQRVGRSERFLRLLASLMGFFWVTGAMLYLAVFNCMAHGAHGHTFVDTEYLLHSLICSLELFMFEIDDNIFHAVAEHGVLKGIITIQAVLSFSCTMSVLGSLVYARIGAYLSLRRLMRRRVHRPHLYLFFGMSAQAAMLARSIRRHDPDKSIVLFVENTDSDTEEHGSWNRILGLFMASHKVFEEAASAHAYVALTNVRISEAGTSTDRGPEDVFAAINLPRVAGLLRRVSTFDGAEIHVFALSDDEGDNMRSINVLSHDSTLCSLASAGTDVRFYMQARRNVLNRAIEDISLRRGIDVRIVDTALLSVEELRHDVDCHPIQVMKLSETNPATVDDGFDCMVVGFGDTGRDALAFLYEYGSFVSSRTTPGMTVAAPFSATVVDPHVDNVLGAYMAAHEALRGNRCFGFVNAGYASEAFYDILRAHADTLKYVVIATGDDEESLSTGLRIFEYVRRLRADGDISRLRIMVRCHAPERRNYMQSVIDHYNEGLGQVQPVFRLFGCVGDIFTEPLVVRNRYEDMGRAFLDSYCRIAEQPNVGWRMRRDKAALPAAGSVLLDSLRGLRRKESQDISNAMHAQTKIEIMRRVLGGDDRLDDFVSRYFGADGKTRRKGELGSISYPGLSEAENRLVANLARLEHLRWNAAHEMLGYAPADDDGQLCCDERSRTHNCLTAWEALDGKSVSVRDAEGWACDYKAYDYAVVDTTVSLYGKMRKESENVRKAGLPI